MGKTKNTARAALIIIIFTLASKVLGFFREILIAAKFGSGADTDTFFIALAAIGLFTSMITQSINTTMIPVLSEVEVVEGKEGKKNHTSNLLNIICMLSFAITILAWILAPLVVKSLAAGFEGEQFSFAVLLMRIGLPAIIFAGVQGVFAGYLESELMFTESSIAQFPYNFVYIFSLVFMSSIFGIKGLMVTSVLATLSQIIIQIPGMKKAGFRYRFMLDFKDKYAKKIIYLIPPVLISTTVNDINKMIDKSLASGLVEGSISALNYASKLEGLSTGIFITAITTVIYPMLSQRANKDNLDGFKKSIIYGINIILLITIPAMVGMIILANPIVRVAFQRGAFDSIATYMTVGALSYYAIGLVGTAAKFFLSRVFYSLQDTKTPMINSFIALGINIVLNFALINFMQHRGLALATSISAIATSLFLLYRLKGKIGSFGFMRAVACGLKSLAAASIMGIVVYFLNKIIDFGAGTLPELIALLISAGVGALVYFIFIYLFKVEELSRFVEAAKAKLKGIGRQG
ncbi:MAG: murein biosynthesis integral membrane protein MurJ [Clostridium sp.]|nr:murein biosynthesis integral membrane protein MurJ [Clostridium sp.]